MRPKFAVGPHNKVDVQIIPQKSLEYPKLVGHGIC